MSEFLSKDYSSSDDSSEEDGDFDQKSLPEKMLWASKKGKSDIIISLIDEDKNLIHATDSDNYTPLHRACYSNHIEIVKLLLENGASVKCTTVDGWTPLHSASRWNNYECAALLIDHGADVNATTESLQTPLHLAASNRKAKETIQLLLLHKLINTSMTNKCGETAKLLAQRNGPFGYMFGHDDEILMTNLNGS